VYLHFYPGLSLTLQPPGLKLANASGVFFKLNQYFMMGEELMPTLVLDQDGMQKGRTERPFGKRPHV
jgi:hypothetical protein